MKLCLLLLVLSACGGAQSAPERARPDPMLPTSLYPLEMGNAWSFDVDNGIDMTLGLQRVQRAENGVREVASGQTVITYELRPEGIYEPSRSAYVLRIPIEEGAEWEVGEKRARVTSTDAHVETPAGVFDGCVIVEVSGGTDNRTDTTTYCPYVGPVVVESAMHMNLSGETIRVVGRLRGYIVGGEMGAR